MSLSSQISSLATRIAQEFNAVRSEVGNSGAIVSDTAPASPTTGTIWYDSINTRTYVYYDSYWVEAASPVTSVGQLDGGFPSTTYGGISPIDAGGV